MNTADHSKPYQNAEGSVSAAEENTNPDQEGQNVSPLHSDDDARYASEEDLVIRINILEQELDRTRDQMIRALAEADNTRKRAQREREDASKFAISSFSRDLISVADNLRRALNAVPADMAETNPEIKNLLSGIEATERDLLKSFDKNGIQKIDPVDEMFDPHFHEVIFEAVIPNKPSGMIIQVVEAGYVLNGRVLRPARVGVSKSDNSGPIHSVDTQA